MDQQEKINQTAYINTILMKSHGNIIFMAPFKITKCSKLRWFQTCINHKIFVTNNFLCQINTVDSPNCYFCSTNEETIAHLFWKPQQLVIEKFQEMSIHLYHLI